MPNVHRPPRVGEHCYYDELLSMGFWHINYGSGRCHFSTPQRIGQRPGLRYTGEVCTIHKFHNARSKSETSQQN